MVTQSTGSEKASLHQAVWAATLCLLVGAFAFIFALEKIYNYDFWWHLRTGLHILETHTVPNTDPFSFTTEGAPWAPHYWLADLGMAAVASVTGTTGLLITKALLVALTFALAYKFLITEGASPLLAAMFLGATVPIARFRFLLRPAVLMPGLALLTFVILYRYGHRKRLLFALLAPLIVLWTNLHASFVLCLVLVACLAAEEILRAFIKPGQLGSDWRTPAKTLVILAILAALTVINPFGLDLHRWIIDNYGDFTSPSGRISFQVEEALPLQWGSHRAYWALMLVTAVTLAVPLPAPRMFLVLSFLATSYLSLNSVRYVALAAIFQSVILTLRLRTFATKTRKLSLRPVWKFGLILPMLILVGTWTFQRTFSPAKVYQFGVGVNETRFPEGAVGFLEEVEEVGNLFNSWEFGGYLLWRRPDFKNFIDGRCLEAQLVLAGELQDMNLGEFEALVERFQIAGGVLRQEDRRAVGMFHRSPRFLPFYFDDQSVVYLRAEASSRSPHSRVSPFTVIQPEAYDFTYITDLALGPDAADAESELRRAVELAPGAFKPRFLLGVLLERQGKPEAVEQFASAIENNPRLAHTHYRAGLRAARLALANGQPGKASDILETAAPFGLGAEESFLLGTAQYLQKNYRDAEKSLKRSLRLNPRSQETKLNLGWAYLDSDRPSRAAQVFGEIVASNRKSEAARYGFALATQQRGQTTQAADLWRSFLKEFPDSQWAVRAAENLASVEGEPRSSR